MDLGLGFFVVSRFGVRKLGFLVSLWGMCVFFITGRASCDEVTPDLPHLATLIGRSAEAKW